MQDRYEEFQDLDTEVIAISIDPPEKSRTVAGEHGFAFRLLADPDCKVTDLFGLRHSGGGPNGDIARPATFIADREGRIVWRTLMSNWRVRVRVQTLIDVLQGTP